MADQIDFTSLKKRLDQLDWPSVYMFKFIVPIEQLKEVSSLFEKSDFQTKVSKKGNYISVTAKPLMYSSENVIGKYKQALLIKDLVAL